MTREIPLSILLLHYLSALAVAILSLSLGARIAVTQISVKVMPIYVVMASLVFLLLPLPIYINAIIATTIFISMTCFISKNTVKDVLLCGIFALPIALFCYALIYACAHYW